MALLQARGVNLLVLDEPTNHWTYRRSSSSNKLGVLRRSLLLVTHDRRLGQRRLDQRWHVHDGEVSTDEG